MNLDQAWQNFMTTGKIQDYLIYKYEDNKLLNPRKEEKDANKNKWLDSERNRRR